jgi:hypothetical protein
LARTPAGAASPHLALATIALRAYEARRTRETAAA